MSELTPLADVVGEVMSRIGVTPVESIVVQDALGRVVVGDITASENVPSFRNSAMDGFAVCSSDTSEVPVELEVVGDSFAGHPFAGEIHRGQVVRIMTGAVVPDGADAVCMVENSCPGSEDRFVSLLKAVTFGENIRYPGEDVAQGAVAISSGTRISAAHLGVLTSLGVQSVPVRTRPRVGVMSTGDELATGQTLNPGSIRDANRPTLLALLAGSDCEAVDLGLVRDDPDALCEAISLGAQTLDAIVMSGGVSVGDADYVKIVLEDVTKGDCLWRQVAVKPAKPFALGTMPDGTIIFGLPGNPVSAVISFELFVRPALRMLGGQPDIYRPTMTMTASASFERRPDGKTHFVRSIVSIESDGSLTIRPCGNQGSHILSGLAGANALAVVGDGHGTLAGQRITAMLLDAGNLPSMRSDLYL